VREIISFGSDFHHQVGWALAQRSSDAVHNRHADSLAILVRRSSSFAFGASCPNDPSGTSPGIAQSAGD
jgi:hypothetical protein